MMLKRRILALLLTLCMVAVMVPMPVIAGAEEAVDDTSAVTEATEPAATEEESEETEENKPTGTPNATVTVLSPMVLNKEKDGYLVWGGSLPEGTVDCPLQIVMNFKANDTLEEAIAGGYSKYLCDFYLEFSGIGAGTETDSLIANGCYLAGNYGTFGWIVIPVDGLEVKNGVPYPVVKNYDASLNYKDICNSVKNFTAAIYIDETILTANPNFKVTLSLKMTNPNDPEDVITVGQPATYDVSALSANATGYENVEGLDVEGENNEAISTAIEALKGELTDLENAKFEAKLNIVAKSLPDENGKIVYDVTPVVTAEGKSKEITGLVEPLSFRLLLLSDEEREYAEVFHGEESLGLANIQSENGIKYVEVSSKTFSEYSVVPVDEPILKGEGTEESPYLITSLGDLKLFRDLVNAGDNYSGKYIKVTAAEIDLKDEEWTPIGYMGATFKGNFDGNGVIIKNLKITKTLTNAAENNGIGFFGRTDAPAVIKNITIENVDITGSLYVGAVVGFAYTGKSIENCTVKGNIAIDAWWYAGVIGGNGYMSLVNNCHVIGNAGSYVKGNEGSYIGGIWGFRGEGANKITNCTVTNLSIIGVDRVGGISGIAHYGNTISTVSVDTVTIEAKDPDATTVGLVAGACQGTESEPSVIEKVTLEEVSAKIGVEDVTDSLGLFGTNINGSAPVTNFVAKIGNTYYETFTEAVAAAKEDDTVTILAGTVSEGDVKLPTTLKNVTFKGEEGAVLKDMTVMAIDGNSFSYIGLTFDGITFENSRLIFTGWRSGDEVIENLTVENCVFKNLDDTTNNACVHINKDETEPVNGFTFKNNVIDGATGGSKSGIYLQATGKVTVENNIINNVSFRPFVVQITSNDGVADEFIVTGNTFSGTKAGRAQALGNNDEGTDSVNLVVSDNIFKDITDSQQICYWNFNTETTTSDFSDNYFDIDIEANPKKIYYNKACDNSNDLYNAGVTTYYTELNEDGTINEDSKVEIKVAVEVAVAKIGEELYYNIADAVAAAKANGGTITLLADIEESLTFNTADKTPLADKIEITVDLNGHTVTSAESTLWVSDGYVVTVKDDIGTGAIITTSKGDEAIAIARGGKVILESGRVVGVGYGVYLYSGAATGAEELVVNGGSVEVPDGGTAIAIGSGKVTVNGGKVICDKEPSGGGWNTYVYQNCTLEITGGVFRGTIGNNGGKVSISGGTFSYCDDPNDGFRADHLAKGYSTKTNADGSITVYALPTSLQGTGTEADPFLINNIDDLKFFRDNVNSGTRYNGQFVKLNADIDLNDEEWTPIGDRNIDQGSFLGTFDGGNHTISNLWISKWTKTGAGFFSKVGMQTEYVSGTVKNLTFENVTIISSESYVGVIAQAPLGALIENVHITGDVNIQGYGYVGGIVGHGYPTINNCSVDAQGTITANYWGAGAILGFAGDYGAKINNATVKNVKIHAELGAAASVAGSPYGAKVDGATVSDVTITSNSDNCMSYVAGGGSLENVTINNVTATANGQPITPGDAVAKINNNIYFKIADAFKAAVAGDTIYLMPGTISEHIEPWSKSEPHSDDKTITILGAAEWAGEGETILTGGMYLGHPDGCVLDNTITVKGITFKNKGLAIGGTKTVVVENNKFENIEGAAIEVTGQSFKGDTDASVTVKGNVIDTTTDHGINLNHSVNITVEGNTVKNVKANAVQIHSYYQGAAANEIVIKDNTLENWANGATEGRAIRVGQGQNVTINGNVMIHENAPEQFVKVTSLTGDKKLDASANCWGGKSPMEEGMFATDLTVDPASLLISYYTDAEKTDLVNIPASVAKTGDTYYETLQAAIDAAQESGDTVTLLTDLTIESDLNNAGKGYFNIVNGKKVTIDLNEKTINVTDNSTGNFILFYSYGELTIKNGTVNLTATNDRDWNAESAIILNRGGVLNVESGTYTHKGGTDMAFVVDNSGNWYGDATATIKDGTLTSSYIAIRNRMEQNSHGASGTAYLNVEGGTISGSSRAIWAQAASTSETSPAKGEIKVSGGEIGLIDTPRGTGAESMTVITGGTVAAFKGEVGELKVTGGTLEEVTILTADGEAAEYVITNEGLYIAAAAKIGDTNYASVFDALKASKDNDTIIILPGKHTVGDLTHEHFYANGDKLPENLTIKGEGEGVVLDALRFNIQPIPTNMTVENITFDGEGVAPYSGGISSNKGANGLTVRNCSFINGAFLSIANEVAKKVVVENCVFDGVASESSAIYIQHVDGLTVTGTTVKNGSYNAIQCNYSVAGNITIKNNIFSGINSRNIYLNGLTEAYNGILTIEGNSFCVPVTPKEDGNYLKTAKPVSIGYNTYEVDPTNNMGYYFTNNVDICVAKIGDVEYADIQAALTAAQVGDKVILASDVVTGNVIPNNGVIVDLNGNVLEVNTLVAFDSNAIIDSVGGGKVKIADATRFVLHDRDNGGYMPIYSGDGFVFAEMNLSSQFIFSDTVATNNSAKVVFRPIFGTLTPSDFFKDGAVDNKIHFNVDVVYYDALDDMIERKFTFAESIVESVYREYAEGETPSGFALTFTNISTSISDMTVSISVVSDSGVIISHVVGVINATTAAQ